ncbi:guanylate kinase [Trichlorobacter thiogenes]|uniref:Guanylate kinase n=1 Tax=Trichlorobacter thiogenes TaxID=115783 RepID=A0A1T4QV86_9BACT|nr:guanylate kinase [Trichlorobacter thiogenes]SKA07497.1 guanylate kinase [Trichlorobacter thiogenes]
MQQEGLLIVISAPSGAGKTTLCNALVSRFPALKESISYTTRQPRQGEQDGVDYHFVSVDRFKQMVAEDGFAEWAEVHGNFYGTAIATLEQARIDGIDILLDIDCQGARILKDRGINGLFVFVLPPSMTELRRRLESRSSDAKEVIERRIARATEEIREARWYDYIVVNDRLDEAHEALSSIVTAARQTTGRMLGQVSKMFDI